MTRAMALVVQKFGGTSVADATKILAAAKKAIARAGKRHAATVKQAKAAHDAAMAALGNPPTKP